MSAPDAGNRVRIDQIVVELEEEAHAQDAHDAIRQALAILASRLAGAQLGGARAGTTRGLALIELEPIPAQWLSTPQAAQRIADELYVRVLGGENQ
jgi:hypothetical protein